MVMWELLVSSGIQVPSPLFVIMENQAHISQWRRVSVADEKPNKHTCRNWQKSKQAIIYSIYCVYMFVQSQLNVGIQEHIPLPWGHSGLNTEASVFRSVDIKGLNSVEFIEFSFLYSQRKLSLQDPLLTWWSWVMSTNLNKDLHTQKTWCLIRKFKGQQLEKIQFSQTF